MNAVILAAGVGRRLRPLTDTVPKCFVEVGGKPLLLHQLDVLVSCGIKKIVLVVGYRRELVEKRIGKCYRGVPLEYVVNDDYSTTNNIYSLWLAKDHLLEDDVVLLECDVIFDRELLIRLLEQDRDAVVLVDRFQLGMDGTVVDVDKDGVVRRIHTRSEQSSRFDFSEVYKTVNVYKFSKRFLANVFVPSLDLYVKNRGVTSYYELVLAILVYIGSPRITALSAEGLRWYEIDDQNDLERAEYIFGSGQHKLRVIGKTYGGYWRYDFDDFSYLTNPFFPPDSMIAEMKYKLEALIANYPSGQEELDTLVSRMFNISPANVVVGNGSSQLIQMLGETLVRGPIVVPLPTFGEYERFVGRDRIVPYYTAKDQFHTCLQDYGKLVRDVGSGVLINPDNPTGFAVRKDAFLEFLDSIQDHTRLLVLDESFTDFIDGAGKNTLLRQQIIEQYPFVAVVRSLSKEFGVAGLRLGLLAAGNSDIVSALRNRLPIWNINSLAQLFLESFLKYRDEYALSCMKVIESRNVLYEGLKGTFLKPFPSFADFVFCEVAGGWTAPLVCDELFKQSGILIKNLGSKNGLEHNRYVRIASRTLDENRKCLSALMSLGKPKQSGTRQIDRGSPGVDSELEARCGYLKLHQHQPSV